MNVHGLAADAVLFDCDGVLVDSEPVSFTAWAKTLAGYGQSLDQGTFSALVGSTEQMVAERFAPSLGVDPLSLELEARRAFEEIVDRVVAFPDAIALIEVLEISGVPLAVATNGLRWRLDALLTGAGLQRLIPVSITADEVDRPKPAPDLYLAAAGITGVAPDRCVVIEDSPTGIAAGRAAGCTVVAVDRGIFERSGFAAASVIVDRV